MTGGKMADGLLGLIPTMQGIALLESNFPKKKKKRKGIVKQGIENIVGITLIGETAKFIG